MTTDQTAHQLSKIASMMDLTAKSLPVILKAKIRNQRLKKAWPKRARIKNSKLYPKLIGERIMNSLMPLPWFYQLSLIQSQPFPKFEKGGHIVGEKQAEGTPIESIIDKSKAERDGYEYKPLK